MAIKSDPTLEFITRVFGISEDDVEMLRRLPADGPEDESVKMTGIISLKNQPEFAADAPWRLEPDQEALPVVFYIRDADAASSADGPWKLDLLKVQQWVSGEWETVLELLPADLPGVDENGEFAANFWSFDACIPLAQLKHAKAGERVRLQVTFIGSFPPHKKRTPITRFLETRLAEYALPVSRAALPGRPRRWFYGDTHYHSAYTNDIKEYGGSLPATRQAAQAVGLDWLVVTDHSVDLDEADPPLSSAPRWDRLKAELAGPGMTDERFRFILGEEITLFGKDQRIVHFLAIGRLHEMFAGSFLPENGGFQAGLYRSLVEKIVRYGKGYSKDIPRRLFGQVQTLEEVLAKLPSGTLAFAAHPYEDAQVPPAKWAEEDLARPRLTGHEFWNGRARKQARQTDNPFEGDEWTDKEKLARCDRERIAALRERAAEKWDAFLQAGVDDWPEAAELPRLRPVFIGGTDAHGDFNYHTGVAWNYSELDLVDDNALGRVRTVVYVPDHPDGRVPGEDVLLAALEKGCCVVTDGPVIEMTAIGKDDTAQMGEALVVDGSEADVHLLVHTTPEFGQDVQVELVSYFAGEEKGYATVSALDVNEPTRITLNGRRGYVRAQAVSVGEGGEQFCCFTNPIWICLKGDGERTLQVTLEIPAAERSQAFMTTETSVKERTGSMGGVVWSAKLPAPDGETLNAIPDELRQAWVDYMIAGYENNKKMFKETLDAFMQPYKITIVLYVILFAVGVLFFGLAAYLGLRGGQPVEAVGFGGLGVAAFIAFFIRQPVQALEENLEFISWLGVAFNTYWTRLMYISNKQTVQEELKAATDDYCHMVERLIDKHARLRTRRPGKDGEHAK